MKDMYSIIGFYHQQEGIGIQEGFAPFGGFGFHDYSIKENNFEGLIGDGINLAEITGRFIPEKELSFAKKYRGRNYDIDYNFKFNSEKNLWVGVYSLFGVNDIAICKIFKGFEKISFKGNFWQSPEKWAQELMESMIKKGMLIQEKDVETGEEY